MVLDLVEKFPFCGNTVVCMRGPTSPVFVFSTFIVLVFFLPTRFLWVGLSRLISIRIRIEIRVRCFGGLRISFAPENHDFWLDLRLTGSCLLFVFALVDRSPFSWPLFLELRLEVFPLPVLERHPGENRWNPSEDLDDLQIVQKPKKYQMRKKVTRETWSRTSLMPRCSLW